MALQGPRQAFGITFNGCYYRVVNVSMKRKDSWTAIVHIFARKPELDADGIEEHLAPIDGMLFNFPVDIHSPLNAIAQAYDFMKAPPGDDPVSPSGLGLSAPDFSDV